MQPAALQVISIAGRNLETRWIGPPPSAAPTLVFLHEGLGCVSLWRDFPDRLAAATGCGALVYSRAGYGASEPLEGEPAATDLRRRLARYHATNTEAMLRGWIDVWLRPEFLSWNIEECLPSIACPMLVVQGTGDEYGTLRQVEIIAEQATVAVETLALKDCGHSPHVDCPAEVLGAATRFISGLIADRPTLILKRSEGSRHCPFE